LAASKFARGLVSWIRQRRTVTTTLPLRTVRKSKNTVSESPRGTPLCVCPL